MYLTDDFSQREKKYQDAVADVYLASCLRKDNPPSRKIDKEISELAEKATNKIIKLIEDAQSAKDLYDICQDFGFNITEKNVVLVISKQPDLLYQMIFSGLQDMASKQIIPTKHYKVLSIEEVS